MLTRAEAAAEVVWHYVNHAAHGYSQPHRLGDGTLEAVTLSDGETVLVPLSDVDCSRLMQVAYGCLGIVPMDVTFTTYTMQVILRDCGFVRVNLNRLAVGDILWKPGHTEMYLGNGMQGGARIDESGTVMGHVPGDQTGREVAASPIDQSYWQWQEAWRYFGPEKDEQEADEDMDLSCIISISNRNTLVWFDGQNVNDLTSTKDVDALNKVSRAVRGRDMTTVKLTEEEFARLCQSIRGGYPKHLKALVEKYAPRSPEE